MPFCVLMRCETKIIDFGVQSEKQVWDTKSSQKVLRTKDCVWGQNIWPPLEVFEAQTERPEGPTVTQSASFWSHYSLKKKSSNWYFIYNVNSYFPSKGKPRLGTYECRHRCKKIWKWYSVWKTFCLEQKLSLLFWPLFSAASFGVKQSLGP